jgi:hypothetical protein
MIGTYLGPFVVTDPDEQGFEVYKVQGGIAYIRLNDGYLTHIPTCLIDKMTAKGIWRKQ